MASVLFVGDSITVGKVGYPTQTDGSSFRRKIQTSLGWSGVGPTDTRYSPDPNGLLHGGIGGATTTTFVSGAAQFVIVPTSGDSWLQKYRPNISIVMLGVNDIISNPSAPPFDTIIKNLQTLCGYAYNESSARKFVTQVYVSTIVEGGPGWYSIAAHALNQKILSTDFGRNARPIDGCGIFNRAFWQEGTTKNLQVDGTHPNQRGYDLISAGILSGMRPSSSSSVSTGQRVVAAGLIAGAAWGVGKWLRAW